jgi:hypothetical protein
MGHVLPELTAHAGQVVAVSAEGEAMEGGVVETIVVGCRNDV